MLSLVRIILFLAVLAAGGAALAQQRQLGPLPNVTAPTVSLPIAGVPASLAGSASFTSGCINAQYYRSFTAFGALVGAGTLQVQRYIDFPACTLPAGAAVPSTALALASGATCPSSSLCGTVGSNDGMSFGALKITITDTSSSSNGVVSLQLLMGAE